MLKNYFTAALRSLQKNKFFSIINIAGLSIGMAACLLILQYVSFELSYDQFNQNASTIYRVVNDRYQNGKLIQHGTITYSAIGRAMQEDYPQEILRTARVEPANDVILTYNEKKLKESGLAVDTSFLTMFSYPLIAGDSYTSLKAPFNMIISQSMADKLFGVPQNGNYTSYIGKAIQLQNDSALYNITGISKDVPENSHLKFNFLVSWSSLTQTWKNADYSFEQSDFWQYIQLKPGVDYKRLEARFPAFSQKHFQGAKVSGSDETFYLQPLSKAHLYSDFEYEIGITGNATTVWGLLTVALFIIIIAWVNYVNLTTAKSAERAKEVGVRKVAGASKSQLIRQFFTESVVINLIAFCIAITLVILLQNSFNQLVQHNLSLKLLLQKNLGGYTVFVTILLIIMAGFLVSGFYPSFVFSSFKPITVLKGKFSHSAKGILLRKTLVVVQFTMTVVLIIGSVVVYRQVRFMNKQKLGITLDQVLVINPPMLTKWDSTFIRRVNSFTDEVRQLPHVKGATTSFRVAGEELGRDFKVRRADADDNNLYTIRSLGASTGFIDMYGIQLLAGRDFEPTDFNTDWGKLHNIILNQHTVKLLGFKDDADAIGKKIKIYDKSWDVIGVMADFHQKSLRYPIEPTVLMPAYSENSPISVKLDVTNVESTIASVRKKFNTFFPGNMFDYYFLDERYNTQYRNEQFFGKVFGMFAGFAVFVACLGLLGLSLFATIQRTKEIGVRKVLGASVANIIFLLSKDFIKLVIIAIVIACPIAWFTMNKWLQDFSYRINISWWIFLATAVVAITIALATISFHALKSAFANPVKSLRTE